MKTLTRLIKNTLLFIFILSSTTAISQKIKRSVKPSTQPTHTVSKLQNSLCLNVHQDNFDESMEKLIDAIK